MTNKTLTIKLTYSNGIEALGTDYFNASDPCFEDKMQKRGRELGAKFAMIGNNSAKGIKYDDKHSDKLTGSDGEG